MFDILINLREIVEFDIKGKLGATFSKIVFSHLLFSSHTSMFLMNQHILSTSNFHQLHMSINLLCLLSLTKEGPRTETSVSNILYYDNGE